METLLYQGALILEGGGFRGVYTAGVLDFFMEKQAMFASIYGISAGACNALSYLGITRTFCTIYRKPDNLFTIKLRNRFHIFMAIINISDFPQPDRFLVING